jgi:hypothetical protein
MAEKIVSPGVFTNEKDLSFLAQGIGEIGAAIVGPFKQGTAFVPTIITSPSEFEDIFGTPDGTYYTEYAVQNYLREAGVVTIVRVAGIEGYSDLGAVGIAVNDGGDSPILVSALFNTDIDLQNNIDDTSFSDEGDGLFKLSGTKFETDVIASIFPSDVNDISDVFGSSAQGMKSLYSYTYFENIVESITGSSYTLEKINLPEQDFGYEATQAYTPWITSQEISGERYELFRIHTIGHGQVYNTKFKVSISNVKPAGSDPTTEYATFSLSVRRFDDIDKRKIVLENYNNLTLDPNSPNYIARRIGDRYYEVEQDGKIIDNGDYGNVSKYIWVEVGEEGSFPVSAAPFGHQAYLSPIFVGDENVQIPSVVYSETSTDNTSLSFPFFSGIDLENSIFKIDNTQYLKPIPVGSEPVGDGFSLDGIGVSLVGSKIGDLVPRQFIVAFQGGFDGQNPVVKITKGSEITDDNSQGFDLSSPESAGSQAYFKALNTLSDATSWDINLIATPGVVRNLHSHISDRVIDMVESREDAFYIADLVGVNDSIQDVVDQASEMDTNYAASYYPWVKMSDINTGKVIAVPPSTLLPGTYAANDRVAAEWFAPAGLNRGGIGGAVSVMNRLTHSDRDTLYENKVNPISAFPGQGIVAYGQKTLQNKASALDRINVRRLLITVKKYIASTSRFLVFEQNTSITRNRFLNTVNPYLEAIQQRQGLYAFNVVMDESNNTPDVIDRNLLVGQLFLQPTRTAEFIVIDFNILPTGGQFSA